MKKIEQELAEKGLYVSTTVGDSMWPMLRNRRDTIILKKPERELRRYDLPMYKRPSGQYVLHRILHVQEDAYIICGDNRYQKEVVPKEWVLGVVTEFYRGDKKIDSMARGYRIYTHVWCDCFWVRAGILWMYHVPGRIIRKMRRGRKTC